jgi:hypothetical protein
MLIIDDYLLFRALRNDYSWLPEGHDPADLATTTDWHFRFLSSIMKPTLEGVHSNRFALLDTDTQEKLLARALSPAPMVSLLDFRLSVNAAATIRATYRRVGFVVAGAIASAVVHNAELSVVAITDNLHEICDALGVVVHHIPRSAD